MYNTRMMQSRRPPMLQERLAWLEARLQNLVEGSLRRLFPDEPVRFDLAHHLITAMREAAQAQPDGRVLAPNLYLLLASPAEAAALQADPGLPDSPSSGLVEAGQEIGLEFSSLPVVQIQAEPALKTNEFQIQATHSNYNLDETTSVETAPPPNSSALPRDAFLIVDGTRIFSLVEGVVNIGSAADNGLVIDDPRVAPLHIQLRALQGRYVLFDLGPAGRTLVNSHPAFQVSLHPGDVISLGGIPLVYGQEQASESDTHEYFPENES
jgi:hypothetical protein